MHLLLKKRDPAAPCLLSMLPRRSLSLQQIEFKLSLLSQQSAAHGNEFLALPGPSHAPEPFVSGTELQQGGCSTAVADVPTVSALLSFSDSRPLALPKGLQQAEGSAHGLPRAQCLRSLTNRTTALLHFRAGLPMLLQQEGFSWKPRRLCLGLEVQRATAEKQSLALKH